MWRRSAIGILYKMSHFLPDLRGDDVVKSPVMTSRGSVGGRFRQSPPKSQERRSTMQPPTTLRGAASHAHLTRRRSSEHAETKQHYSRSKPVHPSRRSAVNDLLNNNNNGKNSSRAADEGGGKRTRLRVDDDARQPSIHKSREVKRWTSASKANKRKKRTSQDSLALPSLASPTESTHTSPHMQQNRKPQTSDKGPADSDDRCESGSTGSNLTTQRTAMQCVEHASRRQAAAKESMTSASKISSSLRELLSDSAEALDLAQQSRVEAEAAAKRAEAAQRRVSSASQLASKDKERATVELDEANAQAEEAWEFLRRVQGGAHSRENCKERIGTMVETGKAKGNTLPRKQATLTTSFGECKAKKSTKSHETPQGPHADRHTLIDPERKFKGHSSPVTQVAALSSTSFLSSSWDMTIKMWNSETGECIRSFEGHRDWVHAISVFGDSKHFISGSDDRTVKLWNCDRKDCVRTFEGHASFVKSLTPIDATRFLSGSRDRTIKLFSISCGSCLQTFQGHTDVVSVIAALSSSNRFVSGSHDNTIQCWNLSSGLERTLQGHTGPVKTIAVLGKDEIVSGSDDKTIRMWNVSSGQCVRQFGSGDSLVYSLTFICNDFFFSCGGSTIKMYHAPSGRLARVYETPRISLAAARLDDLNFVTASDQILYLWKF